MNVDKPSCVFCKIDDGRVVASGNAFIAIRDSFPVTPLHTLVLSKRHVPTYFDLNVEEAAELNSLILGLRNSLLVQDPSITGFNVGFNVGEDAGQTVMHFHLHIIPRRKDDIADPRGGVRGVIPDKRIY